MGKYKIYFDTMGQVKVPSEVYWGAQTQRSIDNFKIGKEVMPLEIIKALAIIKKAVARVNLNNGLLDEQTAEAIIKSADEIIVGQLDQHFPLLVWQTGSGTQTNMNVNEVIANRSNEILGEDLVHPNDHVNKSQSSNDTFPTAMHIAAVLALDSKLKPAISSLIETLDALITENKDIIKIGRTHLQDATPLTLGQEISGWKRMLEKSLMMMDDSNKHLNELAIGGTAVGTGLNTFVGFDRAVVDEINKYTSMEFVPAENKFHSLTSKDELVFAHGGLKALAMDLIKIGNDIRLLASGPRSGLGELLLPENEPGSSIMPGKVNPTQVEALTMVCAQVLGHDTTIGFAASQGNFQLNVYMPVIIYNFLKSVELLADSINSFNHKCCKGIKANTSKIKLNLDYSLMLVTALNPYIGYENAARISKKAHKEGTTLKDAALELNLLTSEEFDRIVQPIKMIEPKRK